MYVYPIGRTSLLISLLTILCSYPVWATSPQLELFNLQGDAVAPGIILNTDVKMQTTGLINQVRVTQRYRNDNPFAVNGRYVFPLPDDSAVYAMTLVVGERRIQGKIDKKAEATRTYQQARQEGKKAALVRQQRANMFVTDVANIEPGQSISVELHYQQTLAFADGEFSVRFPVTITPRYHPMVMKMPDTDEPASADNTAQPRGWIAPLFSQSAKPQPVNAGLTLELDMDLGLELAKVSAGEQPLALDNPAFGRYRLSLTDPQMNKDLVLRFTPRLKQDSQAAFLVQQTEQGERYALLMLTPPADSFTAARRLPRETIFVIDTSGSMHGQSMQQAKQALLFALTQLDAQDSFNILGFNHRLNPLSMRPLEANKANLRMARDFVHSLEADGGTEIAQALDVVLDGSEQNDRVRQVVFLTDGSVSNEAQLFEKIRQQLGDSRLFTVGIGSAPNSLFMNRAADVGRGSYTFIGATFEVQEKMQALFNRLHHPAIVNLSLSSGGQMLTYWPNPLPDLYFGQPLMAAIKLPDSPGDITLTGQTPLGPLHIGLTPTLQSKGDSIARLWARQKIKSLLLYNPEQQVKSSVEQLALQFQLLSPFTAFVAVETVPSGQPATQNIQVPNALPDAGSLTLPQTDGQSRLQLLLGMLLILSFVGARRWIR
ncbi:marine proteobacterial sortase target protein [Bowmanella denitrificans]|uniref:Marine proteobacterial sortase target protein n=1 Tax=Bowmanella denitrificans TaxID=366582 RepID=A0ABN0XWB7_9ALTE|nr:marine proteobacterial sortase target protein [Bowmanella denitrificans]